MSSGDLDRWIASDLLHRSYMLKAAYGMSEEQADLETIASVKRWLKAKEARNGKEQGKKPKAAKAKSKTRKAR